MLAQGYKLKHYIIDDDRIPFEYGNWSAEHPIYIRREGIRRDCEGTSGLDEESRLYYGRQRTITGHYTFEVNEWIIGESTPLYIWGRNGRTKQGGFSPANPLYETSYTEVTSGKGGNEIVRGIIHDPTLNNLTVDAKTYQYNLNELGNIPTNFNIVLYFSAFGMTNPVSIDDDFNSNAATFFPNPASNTLSINFKSDGNSSTQIRIYNQLGNVFLVENYEDIISGIYERQMDVSKLPIGFYILEITTGNKIRVNKLIIIK